MPALHPAMPTGYYRVFGGLAVTRAGRTLLGADTGTVVTVWDADTGNRVTDLIADDGASHVDSTSVGADGVIAPVGVPTTVLRPLFQVGDSGVFLPPGSDSPSAVTLDTAQNSAAAAQQSANDAAASAQQAADSASTASNAVQRGELVYNLADYASLQDAVNAATDGATILVPPGDWPTATTNVNKPLKITGHGTLRASTTGDLLQITSSNVTVQGVTLAGPGLSGNVYTQGSIGIHVLGTSAAPIEGLVIEDVTLTGWLDSAMWIVWPTSPRIVNNRVEDCCYAGIMTISQKGGVISGNTVENIVQGTGIVNSYGIAVTDVDNTAAARAENVTISDNLVKFVRDWEGIDTHGGLNITVTGNVVVGCKSSIAMVSGNNTRICAPTNVVVTGNVVDSNGANSPTGGISLAGVSGGARASGVVLGNTCRGTYGTARISLSNYDPDLTQCDDWIGWTPTWTGLTVGNAEQHCRYMRIGNTVTAQVTLILGSTSAVTSLIDFTLPVTIDQANYATYSALGAGALTHAASGGTGHYGVVAFLLSMSGRVYFLYNNSQVTQSFFAWAAGDKISCTITYEAETASS